MAATYDEAGVSLRRAEEAVRLYGPARLLASSPQRIDERGGYGGRVALGSGWRDPVVVTSIDGVGTKLRLAIELGRPDTVGQDAVAMCVNDVLCSGAQPIAVQDYLAMGRLDPQLAARLVAGVARACVVAGCVLSGGETAELPGLLAPDDYDLAAGCTGVCEREDLLDGSRVAAGDVIVGLAAHGLHSNGFSLVRLLLQRTARDLRGPAVSVGFADLGDELLAPTPIYRDAVAVIRQVAPLHALAHITGGGLVRNIPRVLPTGLGAVLDRRAWPEPPLLAWIRSCGVSDAECARTFHLGLGMVAMVPATAAARTCEALRASGQAAFIVGEIQAGREGCVLHG